MDLQMPVTLVVKAPNQKVADMTVECGLEWTIEKLKQHLSTVYPSKPKEKQQKLIYSGKLLTDQQKLIDILHKFDEDQTIHTVHLVCTPSGVELPQPDLSSKTSTSQQQVPQTSGLRRRNTAETSTPTSSVPPPTPQTTQPTVPNQNYYQQLYRMNPMYGQSLDASTGYYPGMSAMSAQQMMWMQQMYAQQMAQYMQFYQGAYSSPMMPANAPQVVPGQGIPAMPAERLGAAAAAPVNPPAAGEQQQPIRMNAQGGAVFDEEEEDGGQRDWLDWLYTFSRFSVLLSILYFYSTIHRFLAVFAIFVFFYIYEAGWLRLPNQVAAPNVRGGEQVREAQVQDGIQRQENQDQVDPADQQDQENSSENESAPETEEQRAPPGPNAIAVFGRFFMTFFTSLVPQAPPAVNAN